MLRVLLQTYQAMSNDDESYDFTRLYRNRLEKRLVEYLEVTAKLYDGTLEENIQAQSALVGKSIEAIALMLAEQGYMANSGVFVRFTPKDLLTIQKALEAALHLRADIQAQPLGLNGFVTSLTKLHELESKKNASAVATTDSPYAGLSEPPPLVAVDSPPDSERVIPTEPPPKKEEEEIKIKDQPTATTSMQLVVRTKKN